MAPHSNHFGIIYLITHSRNKIEHNLKLIQRRRESVWRDVLKREYRHLMRRAYYAYITTTPHRPMTLVVPAYLQEGSDSTRSDTLSSDNEIVWVSKLLVIVQRQKNVLNTYTSMYATQGSRTLYYNWDCYNNI